VVKELSASRAAITTMPTTKMKDHIGNRRGSPFLSGVLVARAASNATGWFMFISSSSIDTQQQNFRFSFLASPGLHLVTPQLRSMKSSRSGDRDTCRAQPLHHPQIFDIADAPVLIVRVAGDLEKRAR
jgi:hypothetical protein